ncbi:MAG TPA: hypothetical protein VF372_08920, partial [Thermodesulfobacteriota bacterium]
PSKEEIRNPNIEIRNQNEGLKCKRPKRKKVGAHGRAPFLGNSNFGFVSDFDIRISDLGVGLFRRLI